MLSNISTIEAAGSWGLELRRNQVGDSLWGRDINIALNDDWKKDKRGEDKDLP